jgi:hypothetical protein
MWRVTWIDRSYDRGTTELETRDQAEAFAADLRRDGNSWVIVEPVARRAAQYLHFKIIGLTDNDMDAFVNKALNKHRLRDRGEEVHTVYEDGVHWEDRDVMYLEFLQSKMFFSSYNGPCITVIRVDQPEDLAEWGMELLD